MIEFGDFLERKEIFRDVARDIEIFVLNYSSPIINAFLMMENFYEAKLDAFKVFRIEDKNLRDFFNVTLAFIN